MPANTTPDNIPYPVAGDVIVPLRTWFASLASGVQAAITSIRDELVKPALPVPLSSRGADVQAVTATAWADLPGMATISVTVAQPVWVTIAVGAWLAATEYDVRVSARVTGATTLGESQLEVGGGTAAWGQVMYLGGSATAGTNQMNSVRTVRLNAGTNVIAVRAYRSGATGVQQSNYTTLQVSPIRWD